jgi:DNA-binding phage protein
MTTTVKLLQEIEKLPDLNLENDPNFIGDVTKGKLINDILCIMEEKKISKLELAHKLGKSKQYISRILKEKTNLTIDSIAHIACALDSNLQIDIYPKTPEN